jgi:hypothetical protein
MSYTCVEPFEVTCIMSDKPETCGTNGGEEEHL